jgi:DNA-binding transcriptional ArsR family regulator
VNGQDVLLPPLDPVIHAQPRLRVMVALAALGDDDKIAFPRLQELVGMTAGNLATHLRKLEDAGYVAAAKTYRRRTPVTYLTLTRAGRRALEDYTASLRILLDGPGTARRSGAGSRSGPTLIRPVATGPTTQEKTS